MDVHTDIARQMNDSERATLAENGEVAA